MQPHRPARSGQPIGEVHIGKRQRPFSQIWSDETDPVLHGLRHRKDLIKGRCAACRFFDVCNGNMRVRAEAACGDLWASAPACYLTDEEIGIA